MAHTHNHILKNCCCCFCFCCCLSTIDTDTDPEDFQVVTQQKRKLGRVVIRGPQVSLISPEDGMEEIANPFLAAEEEEEEDDGGDE